MENEKTYEKMVKHYRPHAGKLGKKQNTRSVWFSLKKLEEIVAEMKVDKSDGQRIYFGRYNATEMDPQKRERNTLIFVPTTEETAFDGTIYHQDNLKSPKAFLLDATNGGEMSPPNTMGVSWDSDKD